MSWRMDLVPLTPFFDVDWHPPGGVLEGRVLVHILGKHYSQALEAQELRLGLEESGFFINYYEHRFSLDPNTYKDILSYRLADLEKSFGEPHPAVIGLKGLVILSEHLPARTLISRQKVKARQRDKEIIKRSLWLLYQGTPEVKQFIDENLRIFNGEKGNLGSENTIAEARRRNPSINPMAMSFIGRLLLLDFQSYLTDEKKHEQLSMGRKRS